MKKPVSPVEIIKFDNVNKEMSVDLVAVEEPLEIRLKYFDGINFKEKRLAVTMRTPGHDFELALGFLITEGVIDSYNQVNKIFYCEDVKEEEAGNIVIIHLKESVVLNESIFNRNFYVNSSCGVCGKSSLESIETVCNTEFNENQPYVEAEVIRSLPEIAVKHQSIFKHTGGIHASAIFDETGDLLMIREDIGRHNALDKLIGARLIEEKRNSNCLLFVSGRAGFELVQKAIVAKIPVMVAVGAPSSLAVNLAQKYSQTLIGFAKKDKFNVYSGKTRVGFT